jgi:hypothetical protein
MGGARRWQSCVSATLAIMSTIAFSVAPAHASDDPTFIAKGGLGGGLVALGGWFDVHLSLDASISVLSHFRVGAKLWYWTAIQKVPEPAPSRTFAFEGIGPLVDAYTRYKRTEFSARVCAGGTRSVPESSSQKSQLGTFFELSVAIHYFASAVVLGPRLGVVGFGGQDEHFPVTPLVTFELGGWF